jgi:hypothetical protein
MESSTKLTETAKSPKPSTSVLGGVAFRARSQRIGEMVAENLRALAREKAAQSAPTAQRRTLAPR